MMKMSCGSYKLLYMLVNGTRISMLNFYCFSSLQQQLLREREKKQKKNIAGVKFKVSHQIIKYEKQKEMQ